MDLRTYCNCPGIFSFLKSYFGPPCFERKSGVGLICLHLHHFLGYFAARDKYFIGCSSREMMHEFPLIQFVDLQKISLLKSFSGDQQPGLETYQNFHYMCSHYLLSNYWANLQKTPNMALQLKIQLPNLCQFQHQQNYLCNFVRFLRCHYLVCFSARQLESVTRNYHLF